MKAAIRAEYQARIAQLQKEMETVIASLSMAEGTLTGMPKPDPQAKAPKRPALPTQGSVTRPSARARILNQREKLTGGFKRRQLFDAVIADGNGEIPMGTFSLPFSALVKEGEIVEVEKGTGNTPSLYKWKEEVESPATSNLDLF